MNAFPQIVSAPSGTTRSLAEALAAIPTWTDLRPRERRDLTSAATTAARMLGLPPAAVPCDVGWLNERLFDRPPAAYAMGVGRHRNVVSGLRTVLRRMGLHAGRGYGADGLSEHWLAFMAPLNRAQWCCLAPFGRDCSGRGIEPAGVDGAVLAAWAEHDARTRLGRYAARRAALVANAYNRAAEAAGDDRIAPLRAPSRRRPYTLPFSAYPAGFQEDVARFKERLSNPRRGGALSGEGPSRRVKPSTVEGRLFSIRQAAAALVLRGVPIDSLTSSRDLVEPVERAGEILDFYDERCPREDGGGQLASIAATLLIVAAHDVKLTGEPMARIRRWANEARGRRDEMAPKTRHRLRALVQPRARALLLHLPAELMRRAEKLLGVHPAEAARLARLAASLELLLVCPMRQGDLRGLRLDLNFLRLEPRGRRITHVVARAEKTGEPIEWPIPTASARLVERYVDHFRGHRRFNGRLAGSANPYLLPGRGEGRLGPAAFRVQLMQTVEREVGARVHPHLLRAFAAWLHLRAHPGAYEDVRRLLGHRSVETTMNLYVAFEAEAAAARYDRAVLGEREAGKAAAAHAWRDRRGGGRRRGGGGGGVPAPAGGSRS